MKFELVRGIGNYNNGTACIMSAAAAYYRTLKGEDIGEATDCLDCCCPIIRRFLIEINDSMDIWTGNQQRTEYLLPLIPLLVDSRSADKGVNQRRLYALVDWCIREVCPLIVGLEELATLSPIVDLETCEAGHVAAKIAYVDNKYNGDVSRTTYYAANAANYAAYHSGMHGLNVTLDVGTSVSFAIVAVDIADRCKLRTMIQDIVRRLVGIK